MAMSSGEIMFSRGVEYMVGEMIRNGGGPAGWLAAFHNLSNRFPLASAATLRTVARVAHQAYDNAVGNVNLSADTIRPLIGSHADMRPYQLRYLQQNNPGMANPTAYEYRYRVQVTMMTRIAGGTLVPRVYSTTVISDRRLTVGEIRDSAEAEVRTINTRRQNTQYHIDSQPRVGSVIQSASIGYL